MNTKRTALLLMAVLVTFVALSGCNMSGFTGSGTVVSREYDFTDFDELEFDHAFRAVTQGDTYSVVVRIDDNLVDRLLVEQEGNRVKIGLQPDARVARATMEAEITLPRLSRLSADGAVQVQLDGIESAANFIAEATGASRIHGDVNVADVELTATGASNINLAGSGANVRANAEGASTIDLEAFTALDAQTVAEGASTVTVNVEGTLDADASGASHIYYVGQPAMGNIRTSGGSDVGPR
ncbi:MAG TPA: head GIN domain-containing protein [Promineifilum sp.]|nr:head GIN domain-containing protein [Promineifilum sp.]